MIKLIEGNLYVGQINFHTNGNAHLRLDEETEVFIYKKNTGKSLHLDEVEIEIFFKNDKIEGKVISVISRFKKEYVGKVQISKKNGSVFVIPDSDKIAVDFYIKGGLQAEDNKKVVVEFIKWDDSKSPLGKITKILGDSGDNNTEMHSIMAEYGLPMEFPADVIKESELIEESITEDEINKRLDLRNVVVIGIDPEDSKDADDTIGLEILDNGYIVYINIADVCHYVKEGTKLAIESELRSSSIYLVDRVIPMFPKKLSNGICSLKSGKDKLSYSAIFTIDYHGNILDRKFCRTVINVNKDFSYEEAQSIIENGYNDSLSEIDKTVVILDKIAKTIKRNRPQQLEINSSEPKFILDEKTKKVKGIYFKEQKDSNKLIEEFMLLANTEVAKFIDSKKLPCVNRIHEYPEQSKLENLRDFLKIMGYELDISEDKLKSSLNEISKIIKGKPEENMISTLITRTQKKAVYSTKNAGHFGLNFEYYCHFTSPIRRFADYLVHLILTEALGNNGYPIK